MAGTSSPSQSAAPKFTRCRTGCLPCRGRRRKCDEGKPQCSNCIGKGLSCHYGLQLSFLPKNTYTVADRLRTSNADANYNKIRFVTQEPLIARNKGACAKQLPSQAARGSSPLLLTSIYEPTGIQHESSSNVQGDEEGSHDDVVRKSNGSIDENRVSPLSAVRDEPLQLDVGAVTAAVPTDRILFTERDVSAIHGLLELGISTTPTHTPSTPGTVPYVITPDSLIANRDHGRANKDTDTYSTPRSKHGREASSANRSETASLDSVAGSYAIRNYRLELLRHYRYQVAPWLDICDLRHTFGIKVVRMAMSEEQLLLGVMSLSEASIIETSAFQQQNPWSIKQTAKLTADRLPLNTPPLDLTEAAILSLLQALKNLVSNVPETWRTRPNSDAGLLEVLVQNAYKSNILSAAYWMFVRLELGIALANDMAMRIPIPPRPTLYLPLLARTGDVSERASHFTHIALWLCAKALALCHQREVAHDSSTSHRSVEDWMLTFRELVQWYESRPHEFQPMVEMDSGRLSGSDSEFPLLMFAKGVGTFSNQLYHTALVLLLQCKPRTANLQQYQSTLSSPLWHAQRICGIALNNDSRESWDPCLLASLLIASKYMTHEVQQQEILRGFQRITEITGWEIGQYLVDLRDDWSTLEDA